MDLKIDFISFVKQTEGLEDSIDFAIKYGLLPSKNAHTCVKCGREESLRWTRNNKVTNLPYMFVCSKRECRATVAVGRNTLFDRMNLPLSQAIRLIYFWLLKIPVNETCDQLQLKEYTVVEWFKIFKEVCAFVIINYTKPVGGPGCFVEINAYQLLTKEESHDVWLFNGVDRETGQNFIIHVDDLDCEALWPILKNYVLPGTAIVTSKALEFRAIENNTGSESLTFVLPKSNPRLDHHYHLDRLFVAMEHYIEREREMHPESIVHKELYAYKFLYFNRDGFCNVPASELFLAFIRDIKLAYPGFRKTK